MENVIWSLEQGREIVIQYSRKSIGIYQFSKADGRTALKCSMYKCVVLVVTVLQERR